MNKRIIAAVRSDEELVEAAKSDVWMIFMLAPNIEDIKTQADIVHKAGKKFLIHIIRIALKVNPAKRLEKHGVF